jgi:hypothetical protein
VTALVSVGLGCVVAVLVVRMRPRPSAEALDRLEGEVAALRKDVAGYRAAHENQMESLDRRLVGLEKTAARAANELRMASEQLIAHGPLGPGPGGGVPA